MAKLTRTLVYEGDEKWIRDTLEAGAVNTVLNTSFGSITDISRVWDDKLNHSSFETHRHIAKAKGFTGDTCTNCGSFNMMRNGSCLSCSDCGTTTGCS